MKAISLIVLVFILFACTTKSGSEKQEVETVTIDLSQELDKLNLSDLIAEDIRIIPLETTDRSLIGKVSKVLATADYIFILDMLMAQSIFMFSKDGKFIRKIGESGPGPKEIGRPIDFFIENQEIFVLDMETHIKTFDFEGNFIESREVNPRGGIGFSKLNGSGVFAFITGNADFNLDITDHDFKVIHSYFPYQNRRIDAGIINPLFRNEADGTLIYRRNMNDTLYSINSGGELIPYRMFDFGNKSIRQDLLPKEEDDPFWNNQMNAFAQIWYYFETASHGYLAFALNEEFWTGLHSKNTGEVKLFKRTSLWNDVTLENNSYPVGVFQDHMIFLVEPRNIIKGIADASADPTLGHPKVRELAKNLDPDSNPVLLLVKYDF